MRKNQPQLRVYKLCFLIAIAGASPNSGAATAPNPTCVDALLAGSGLRGGANVPELDSATIEDLDIDGLENLLQPYLHTDFGRRRWAWMLRHPDRNNATEIQAFVRDIAERLGDFRPIEEHFQALNDAEAHLLDRFARLKDLEETMASEVLWMSYLWACLIGPSIGHHFFNLPAYASFLIAGQAWGASLVNVKRIVKLRDLLGHYRFHLKSANLMAAATAETKGPIAEKLRDVLIEPPRPRDGWRGWTKRIFDFVAKRGRSPTPFWLVRDRLDRLGQTLKVKLGRMSFKLDLALIWDRFFVSNYGLRHLHASLVDHKEDMAQLFSALGDFEVYLAMARFYDGHRQQTTFLEIDSNAPTPYLMVKGARSPTLAARDVSNTVPTDLNLRDSRVELLIGDANHGAAERLKLYGQISLATMVGLPVFAREGKMSANAVIAQINPPRARPGETPLAAEARRWAEIEARVKGDPFSLVIMSDPFTTAGDAHSLAIREQVLREMAARQNLAIISTNSHNLASLAGNMSGVGIRQMKNFSTVPYRADVSGSWMDPAVIWDTLFQAGVDLRFIMETRLNFDRLHNRKSATTLSR